MKICSTCGAEKTETSFALKNKSSGLRLSACIPCRKEYGRKHYAINRDLYKARAIINKPTGVDRSHKIILEYLLEHPCVDCGNDDIEVLEFDHIIPVGGKGKRVSNFIGSTNKLMQEIAKCEVRCSNCHTKRTRRMNNNLRMDKLMLIKSRH